MDSSRQMGEEKIGALLLKFSIPAIIGMMVNALYNVVDRAFVGQGVGLHALSGITVTYPITIAIMAFGMLIGFGGTAIISIRLGQQKKEEAEQIMGNAFVLLVGVGLVITVLCYMFMDAFLSLLGASPEALPYAKEFLNILLIGVVFMTVGFGMNSFLRGQGKPRIAMATMLLGAILNIILNPIFIFGLKMGVTGSALATVIAQFCATAWVMYYFLSKRAMLKLRVRNFKIRWVLIKDSLAIGLSPFSMQIAASIVTMVFNKSLFIHGGDEAIAAFGAINAVAMFILMPVFGLSQGAQPIMGYNYGARNYERVKRTLKLAALGATGVMTFGFLLVELFPVAIMGLFNDDPGMIVLGAEGIRIYLLMLPIVGFQVTVTGFFQATGRPRKSLFLSLSRQLLFLIPLIWLLSHFFGLRGIWMASPVSDVMSVILTVIWLKMDLREFKP